MTSVQRLTYWSNR